MGELAERDCPICEKRVPFQTVLNYAYRHIWYVCCWISDREYYAVCGNCGNGFPIDKAEARKMFPKDGIPFMRKSSWKVALALRALLFVFGMVRHGEDKKRYAEYLAAPLAGDTHYADLSRIGGSGYDDLGKSAYGVMRLAQNDGETLVFTVGKTASTKNQACTKRSRTATNRTTR